MVGAWLASSHEVVSASYNSQVGGQGLIECLRQVLRGANTVSRNESG